MISERALKQWRRDAIVIPDAIALEMPNYPKESPVFHAYREQRERILRLTQELMDYHLMMKGDERWKRMNP
jgi:hypothetical protein